MPETQKIAAIPTVYRGRRYRSRLEARWASFFDRLGWPHEYEPCDLGSWSPDFRLTEWNILVEVKPLQQFDQEIWDKCVTACSKRGLLDDEEEALGIFLTREAPFSNLTASRTKRRSPLNLGWFITQRGMSPSEALLGWVAHYESPTFIPELVSWSTDGWWTGSGDAGVHGNGYPHYPPPLWYPDHSAELWAKASNDVQWLGRNQP